MAYEIFVRIVSDPFVWLSAILMGASYGKPIAKERRAWARVVAAADLGPEITPHVLRHTCVTWGLQSGVDAWDMSGLTGMSLKTLERVYGHHDPDYQEGVVSAFKRGA